MDATVEVWSETVAISTYGLGVPDTNPMFLEKRVYQGSSGAVYPLPVIDQVSDERRDQPYTAVFLENRYLKLMLLPELGGRLQMALDKTNNYHFIYYNRVVKPALVGLAGPWISGGIEFNWPQHHRPSTFEPVSWLIERHADGSATVWCGEIERMFGQKAVHGFRLYPDRAYLEVDVRLSNPTLLPQTFLWWANPAVHVGDAYQSVFPPDVRSVMDHGKRDLSRFPIATDIYYKVDYAPGTDISRYKNIPVPTSYMAHHSDFDFLGCYDHAREAGMLHIANHHLVPGKKQWTWGNGDFGRVWDRQLTDEDGPYIELMCGAFTDNQPDFSWLMPGEEKRFTQVFLPYKLVGAVKNASAEAALNLELRGDTAELGVYLTAPSTVRVRLVRAGAALFEREALLGPETALREAVAVGAGVRAQELTLELWAGSRLLLAYTPLSDETAPPPEPAKPAPPPEQIASNEELYLNGLHLEQYRHATYAPEPYYVEALRRDPGDARCNTALGLLRLRRGKFAEAEGYFRRAIERLTLRNPNPYDGEPFYHLGLALLLQGRRHEAVAPLYKATWNAAWQDSAFYTLACLAATEGRLDEALALAGRALLRNASHQQARHLHIALLRRLGREQEARTAAEAALAFDPLAYGAHREQALLFGDETFAALVAGNPYAVVAVALDYARAGLFAEAVALLRERPDDPLAAYLVGWSLQQAGEHAGARAAFATAAGLPSNYCFPNCLESVPALQAARAANPDDPRAPYYLGLFWYAHRQYEDAIACWEQARSLDPAFPTVHRNLGLAYYNKRNAPEQALVAYETAMALGPDDARVCFELDQLRKRLNTPPAERLAWLEARSSLCARRDDLMLERITLLNTLGRNDEAFDLLMGRNFHPWEGGEGKVSGQYILCLLQRARRLIAAGAPAEAAALLEQALVYPPNLGEGKLPGARERDVLYELGRAYRQLGDELRASAAFEQAADGGGELTSARYYNDLPPELLFYQGLALRALGREQEARAVFERLSAYGEQHLDDLVQIDYFAVSLPDFLVFEDDLVTRHRIHCHYMQALGALGLGERARAQKHFSWVLALDANHQGAHIHA